MPVVEGTERERAIDISDLRRQSGLITLDEGYVNTGSTCSAITYLDGENGVLRYRGYPIEQLAANCDFLEVAYLLIYGELPNAEEGFQFPCRHSRPHHDPRGHAVLLQRISAGSPSDGHSQQRRRRIVDLLSGFDGCNTIQRQVEDLHLPADRQAADHRGLRLQEIHGPTVHVPQQRLGLLREFLAHDVRHARRATIWWIPILPRRCILLLIVHADHEQNCSTSTVRMVGSSHANLFASISAGIGALWGRACTAGPTRLASTCWAKSLPTEATSQKYVRYGQGQKERVPPDGFWTPRLQEPRPPRHDHPRLLRQTTQRKLNIERSIVRGWRRNWSRLHLGDDYFIERQLYPNVDFYSGVIYRAIGIPDSDVYRLVCHRQVARLDCALVRNARQPQQPNQSATANLHRLDRTRFHSPG